MDSIRLSASIGLLIAAIAGFYWYADQAVWIRLLGMLVMIGLAIWIAIQTAQGRNLWRFASQAHVEVRKVVWPTRQETTQTLLLIALVVLVTALFLWGN